MFPGWRNRDHEPAGQQERAVPELHQAGRHPPQQVRLRPPHCFHRQYRLDFPHLQGAEAVPRYQHLEERLGFVRSRDLGFVIYGDLGFVSPCLEYF